MQRTRMKEEPKLLLEAKFNVTYTTSNNKKQLQTAVNGVLVPHRERIKNLSEILQESTSQYEGVVEEVISNTKVHRCETRRMGNRSKIECYMFAYRGATHAVLVDNDIITEPQRTSGAVLLPTHKIYFVKCEAARIPLERYVDQVIKRHMQSSRPAAAKTRDKIITKN